MLHFAWMSLIDLDQSLFHLLNSEWTNSFFDWLLPVWRDKYFWIPVYSFIILFSISNLGKKAYWFILFMVLSVGTADIISSHVVKKNIQRTRPCNNHDLEQVRTLVGCGSGYSFTSSHAANHFALSYFLFATIGLQFRRYRGWLMAWAGSVAYAQVYVGLHYPVDVIAGAILGVLVAKLFIWLYLKCEKDLGL